MKASTLGLLLIVAALVFGLAGQWRQERSQLAPQPPAGSVRV